MFKQIFFRGIRLIGYCTAIALLGTTSHVFAGTVKFPNGEYQVAVDDLSVKVIGGSIPVTRTWMATDQNHGVWQWLFTPAWSDLQFTYDVIDNSVTAIQRAESPFVKNGSGVFVYGTTGEKQTFIKQTDSGWRWYDTLGNWMTYDTNGRLLSYGDRNVTIAYFVRDGQHRISNILDNRNDAAHPVLTYTYTDDNLTSISDYSGRTVHYHYTGNQLTSVTDVLGNDWVYNYSGGLLTSWSDPEHGPDVTTTITYSGNRVVAIKDPMGFITTYDYTYDRGKQIYTIVEKDPPASAGQQAGVRLESHYDAGAKLIYQMVGSRVVYQLKKDGATEVDIDERGLQTKRTYDSQHNLIKLTYPDGTSTSRAYDGTFSNITSYTDELGIQTTFEYDTHGNLTTKTEALGKPEQRITTYTYNDKGQRLTETVKGMPLSNGGDPNDTQFKDAVTAWTYDQYGNVATAVDPMQHTTQFTLYDAIGDVKARIDARNKAWAYAYNNRGQVLSQTDPLSHSTSYGYDKAGNRTTVTDALNRTITSAYDDDNRLVSTTDPAEDDGTPGGVSLRSYFNDGRLKQVCDQSSVCTKYAYDSDGRLVSTTDGAGNAVTLVYGDSSTGQAGLVASTVYPTYSMTYRHDARSRRIETVRNLPGSNGLPDQQQKTTLAYDGKGRVISITDALGRSTLLSYDALGREIQTTDASNGVTAYTYGNDRSPLTTSDAKTQTHRFSYDLSGYKVSESTPMGEATHYAYDEVGHLLVQTSPTGDRRVNDYDDAGRHVSEKLYAGGSDTPAQTISFSYDDRNFPLGYNQTGETASSASYTWNARGWKIKEVVTYGSGAGAFSKTLESDFYANGKKQFFTYPDATVVAYGYDANNALASATLPGASTIQFTGMRWNVPTQVQYPGVLRDVTLDALLRPLSIKAQLEGNGTVDNPAGAILTNDRYSYDAAGNITQRISLDGEYDFTYDTLDRLTSVVPPAGSNSPAEAYGYDSVGNRVSNANEALPWVYNADNQLLSRGNGADQISYGYDSNGNTTRLATGDPNAASSTRTLIYDAAQRLREVHDNGSTAAVYQYDPFGRRIQKNVAGQITWYQYGDEGLVAEYSQTGELTRAYGWRPGTAWSTNPLWQADVAGNTWNVYYYQNDQVGRPLLLVDSTGAVKWTTSYDSFGRTFGLNQQVSTSARFPGQYADAETGFYYNYHREYDPATGRYLQRDPLGIAANINTYGYADQNPLKNFDPNGLRSEEACCADGEAAHLFINPADGKDNDGAVFCCDGVQVACANKGHVGDKDPSIAECIKEHEDDHKKNNESEPCPTCNGQSAGGGGGGPPPPTRPPGSSSYHKDTSECRATWVEVDCLKKRFKSCTGDPVCLSQIRSRANGKIDNMDNDYMCPYLPPKIPDPKSS